MPADAIGIDGRRACLLTWADTAPLRSELHDPFVADGVRALAVSPHGHRDRREPGVVSKYRVPAASPEPLR